MNKDLKEIFQRSLPEIPESRLMIIAEIMADPEKHHREVFNLFKSGNYKIHADGTREEFELTMGKRDQGYVQSGFNSNDDKSADARVRFDRPIIKRDGSIAVTMHEGSSSHIFVFTKDAIMNLHSSRLFDGFFGLCNQFGIFMKCENRLCLLFDEQIITNKSLITTSECITAVYVKSKKIDHSWSNVWDFDISSDSPDVINFAYGNEVRYCAFIKAFQAALYDGSRGGIYEDLFQKAREPRPCIAV